MITSLHSRIPKSHRAAYWHWHSLTGSLTAARHFHPQGLLMTHFQAPWTATARTAPMLRGNNQWSRKKHMPWQWQKSSPGQRRQEVVCSQGKSWFHCRVNLFAFCYDPVRMFRGKSNCDRAWRNLQQMCGARALLMCAHVHSRQPEQSATGQVAETIELWVLAWRQAVWDEGVGGVGLVSSGFWWWALWCCLVCGSVAVVSTFVFSRRLPVPYLYANPSFFKGI